ncbi:P-loop containing nucleoside triphosphate hydrolase protein [Cytidiella melzeri]|nr:P-loop containing nucleoside triphosphate hydrolase protein [Cytidiella melzeri]
MAPPALNDVSEAGSSKGRKRQAGTIPAESTVDDNRQPPHKKPRLYKRKSAKDNIKPFSGPDPTEWPEYFQELFKALNTVLAFCSSRKALAITFPVVRESVERLLKRPLDLAQVAELKALLPNLVRFAYIPRLDLQVHESENIKRRGTSPDYAARSSSASHSLKQLHEGEHVLVLDFEDNSKGKKPGQRYTCNFSSTNLAHAVYSRTLSLPPALTPAATKKLIERRNDTFEEAVRELIKATPFDDDPVAILQAAARDHIPIDPTNKSSIESISASQSKPKVVPDSEHRPSIESLIREIKEQDWFADQIVFERTIAEKEPKIAELYPPLSDRLTEALASSRQITSFYSHQVEAIAALDKGKSVIVSTSTASGKSVIYQVPLMRFLEQNPQSTAIFIYPTKALAQDQRQALQQLLYSCPGLEHIQVATYDGDTPQDERKRIRESASVIFTNFDMIHFSVLPHEEMWRSRFLKNLKLLAVDELHYYTGTFGSHVAQILRRFRRICAAIGNRRLQFVSCSATITEPGMYMQRMFGIEAKVTKDGAPAGRKDLLVWDAPPVDEMDPALGRQSTLKEAIRLARFLMERGIRLIVFCTIRKSCEMFFKALRAELTAHGRVDILERVMSYRGGMCFPDRRKIEKEAFNGHLLGIVATNALELGVDIGILDAVMMFGFPRGGTASFRQQAGRAGRRARDALAVFVASEYPIDRHFVAHPEELLDKPINELVIDLDSKVIVEAHLQCAGQEMPLSLEDEKYFGPHTKELCETRLKKDEDGWYHTHPKYLPHPGRHISLRGNAEDEYTVVDVSNIGKPGGVAKILEQMEMSRALFELYEGAVFIHQGITFIIKEVSHDSKMAKLIQSDVNWTTEPRDFTNVDAAQTYRIREIRNSPQRAYYGRIELFTLVFGYFKIRNKKIIDAVDVDTPPYERESTGFWLDVPKPILQVMLERGIHPAEAIHAAEHAFLNRFALSADLGTECKAAEKEYKSTTTARKRPARLIFYEGSGRNGGVATKAFDHVSEILQNAHDTTEACQCEEGCAACIVSPSCRENNIVASKRGALIVLKALLSLPIDADLLVPVENTFPHDTVIAADSVRAIEGVEVEKAD